MKQKLTAILLSLSLAAGTCAGFAGALETTEDTVIQVVGAIGIMTGDENNDLHLENNVTRAEFAKMLVCASTFKGSIAAVSNVSPFKDVPYTHWAAAYIKTAVEQKWVSGYLDGTYRPDQNITIEEAVTASLKLLGYTDSDFPGSFPYGQMSVYESLQMDKNISAAIGTVITRRDCMNLIYNLLNTKTKTEGKLYAEALGYEVTDSEISLTSVINETMTGPVVMTQTTGMASVPFTPKNIYRNGVRVEQSSLQEYDVLYYSKAMSTVWAYRNQISGTYEKAAPNSDYPTSVTVSGSSYEIGTTTAAYQLSSIGSFQVGSTVTLLLGKDGKIVYVVDPTASNINSDVEGVLARKGTKTYTDSNGNEYTGLYISVISTDGVTYDFKVESYGYLQTGDMVKVSMTSTGNTVAGIAKKTLSGTVNSAAGTIGTTKVASNVQIIDVNGTNTKTVTLSRLNGMNLSASDTYSYTTDSSGAITRLLLNNATGDAGYYGCVMAVSKSTQSSSLGNYTTYNVTADVNGQTMNYNGGIEAVQGPAAFTVEDGKLTGITTMYSISGITGVSGLYVKTASANYRLADDVLVYMKNGSTYYHTTLSQIADSGAYTFSAVYDKAESAGGRVRVIVATPK